MTDSARAAMDEVVQKLSALVESLELQLSEAKAMLEHARQFPGAATSGVPSVPSVNTGQYASFRPIDALINYLTVRKGAKVPFKKVAADLVAGGLEPGAPRGKVTDPVRLIEWNLRIALPQNKGSIAWEPDGDLEGVQADQILLWLAEDQGKKRKKA